MDSSTLYRPSSLGSYFLRDSVLASKWFPDGGSRHLADLRLRVTYQTGRFRREIAATLEHVKVLGNTSRGREFKQYTHQAAIESNTPLLPIVCVYGGTALVENNSDETSKLLSRSSSSRTSARACHVSFSLRSASMASSSSR